MSARSEADKPLVEAAPHGGDAPDLTLRALRQRIRQQEILAELGVSALKGATLDTLLTDTVRLTAEGLRTEFSKVLEYLPAENVLLVRAGVGWNEGIVGVAKVGADLASPAGFALQTGKPVISNHLENENRFRTPELLRNHNIRRAMNVILQGDGMPFGVLEVDSRSDDDFEAHDLAFLQGAANLLGMAIERERHERALKAALARQQFLLDEMNHRVKNSLAIVAAMLKLQSSDVNEPSVGVHLEEASRRVLAVSRVHEKLFQGLEIEKVDVGRYLEVLCKDLVETVVQCEVIAIVEPGIETDTDRAVSAALIVNELITNACKYAYADGVGGKVWVSITSAAGDMFHLSVRDAGVGLPEGLDLRTAKSLGMRIVNAFINQLKGSMELLRHNPGTEIIVTIPKRAAT